MTDTSTKVFARTRDVASLAVRYGVSPDLADGLTTLPVVTRSTDDFTAIIVLSGLTASTRYYLTLLADGEDQLRPPYPSFHTFPPPAESAAFSVVVIGDTGNQSGGEPHGMGPAFRSAGTEGALLMVQTGDFDHRDPKSLVDKRTVRKDLYDAVISADFVDLTRTMPFFYVWDDHDYGANNADGTAKFKRRSLQVYKEYVPASDLANPAQGIWHPFRVAQAEFFMLDNRSQRSRNSDPDDERKSMLEGFQIVGGQKQWLKERLLASDAVWKIVVSPSVWNPTLTKKDSWFNFQTERRELLDFFAAHGLRNIVILSGDVHWGAIDDGTHGGVPQLVVPNMNMTTHNQGRYNSVWSHGAWGIPAEDGVQNGYGKLTFMTKPHRVLLEVKDAEGATKLQLLLLAD